MAFKAGFDAFVDGRKAHCYGPNLTSRPTNSKDDNHPQRQASARGLMGPARFGAVEGSADSRLSFNSTSMVSCSCPVPLAALGSIVAESSCQISRTSATKR